MFDLHVHSDASDGTEPPAQVVAAAAAAGLKGLALTDHDTTAGWQEASAAAREHGLMLIPGAEVTAQMGPVSVHILSYLHDPGCPGLSEMFRTARSGRLERARQIAANLGEDFDLSWADVLAHVAPEATVGRPHIADALVSVGVVADRTEAFARLLHKGTKYYVPQQSPTPAEAVAQIRDAGGVPVIAHAMASARGATLSTDQLEAMVEAGMLGVEIHHRDNTETGKRLLAELAHRHGLIVTGSSDYHGTGKPNRLGENTTAPQMVERIIEAGTGAQVIGEVSL
ncbi:PHP domain-containing protein [Nesterenkonia populi]|uniref:PHP domain-containing protein n=1 Tax=Nesterenkonia populi TaxID=1591087 RepID=UPI0011BF30EA|nr:PHP domain-containing protein [Nesterenkonia populi]